ncbi:reverse transcriptase/maturase family protein [Shewanella sp. SR1]|uniref:reverse transcriptase domain-containing protein n=1 Tax=Shewanella sp. SR1 TaxID=2855505 RepID=UPI001CF391C4|nr:reverse transcriptase domain-containing protein [Shewanella sp. SR1]MCB2382490.1 reverse transcriptase/maturase family protein [Shewanella sp. SR1]
MKVFEQFRRIYSISSLSEIHDKQIPTSPAMGVDNMSQEIFIGMREEQLEIINRKVLAGKYAFTSYRLKLISKGQGKSPREISIPTVRDRIVLKGLCIFLQIRFREDIKDVLPQFVVKTVKGICITKQYDSFIKLDVSNFYPSIPHEKLIRRLRKRIKSAEILNLIECSISTPTVSKPKSGVAKNTQGVPQGLSISNVLASIYLSNIDKRYEGDDRLKYFRYVDDILILCNWEDILDIRKDIAKRFSGLKLKIHAEALGSDKSTSGRLDREGFSYLGYSFKEGLVTVRLGSVEKLRESILTIFTGYKHSKLKSEEFLMWRLNLRITGCIFNKKSKGWLFFFSEINDESLLHELDFFVDKLCKRFNVSNLEIKKFVRSHYQIQHSRTESKYIQNFDLYNVNDMSRVLSIFGKATDKMSEQQIRNEFNRRIARQVRDLETDIQNAGSTN